MVDQRVIKERYGRLAMFTKAQKEDRTIVGRLEAL
jgi:hypothetical protein